MTCVSMSFVVISYYNPYLILIFDSRDLIISIKITQKDLEDSVNEIKKIKPTS